MKEVKGGTYENSQNRKKIWHAERLYFPVLDCALEFETAESGFCGDGPGGFVSFIHGTISTHTWEYLEDRGSDGYRSHS